MIEAQTTAGSALMISQLCLRISGLPIEEPPGRLRLPRFIWEPATPRMGVLLQLPIPCIGPGPPPNRVRRPYSIFARRPLTATERIYKAELDADDWRVQRPQTRADCAGGVRPCVYVSCKYHLAIDVNEAGSIKVNFGHFDFERMPETCALDVADRGEHTMEATGAMSYRTSDRIRQVERALRKRLKRMMLPIRSDE